MRIISQNKNIDVPYEAIALSTPFKSDTTSGMFRVYMNSEKLNARSVIMAEYKSREKAVKSLEMLREANGVSENGEKYFLFPADDEIEVQQ